MLIILIYVMMWEFMKFSGNIFKNFIEGIRRVCEGNFVFIFDFVVFEYYVY